MLTHRSAPNHQIWRSNPVNRSSGWMERVHHHTVGESTRDPLVDSAVNHAWHAPRRPLGLHALTLTNIQKQTWEKEYSFDTFVSLSSTNALSCSAVFDVNHDWNSQEKTVVAGQPWRRRLLLRRPPPQNLNFQTQTPPYFCRWPWIRPQFNLNVLPPTKLASLPRRTLKSPFNP